MIVEIMGKVQNGTSLAHVRLDAAKNDLETLRRELVSRSNELASKDGEIAELKAKLNEIELSKAAVEKALTENNQKSSEMIQNSSHSTPSRKPLSGVSSSEDSPDVQKSSGGPSETLTRDQSETQAAAESQKIGDNSADQSDQSDAQLGGDSGQPGDESLVQIGDRSDGQLGVNSGAQLKEQSENGAQSGAQLKEQSENGAQSGAQLKEQSENGAHSGAHQVRPQTEDSSRESFSTAASAASRIGQRLSEIQETDGEDKLTSAQQSSRLPGQQKSDRLSKTDVGVQSPNKKDAKRLSDLESEVLRLRKENERILREKADYESAIQRALLRGVSSLNAETLKVLKCPPVSCYSPCRPPPSPVNAAETMMPCFPKSTRDNWTPRGARTSSNGTQSTQGTVRTRSHVTSVPEQQVLCCGGRTATNGVHKSTSRQKKSSVTSDNNSMVFLLHQAEASSVCVTGNTSKSRGNTRAKSKKPENSICVKKLG